MLQRLRTLASEGRCFAFETTLASRGFAPWFARLRDDGYRVGLIFLWLPSSDVALARVRHCVLAGGHDVPPASVRRRYERGLVDFFASYRRLADPWFLFDTTVVSAPRELARGRTDRETEVSDEAIWQTIQARATAR
jgi:predicted ABC-type ATPase